MIFSVADKSCFHWADTVAERKPFFGRTVKKLITALMFWFHWYIQWFCNNRNADQWIRKGFHLNKTHKHSERLWKWMNSYCVLLAVIDSCFWGFRCTAHSLMKSMTGGTMMWILWRRLQSTSWRNGWRRWTCFPWRLRKVRLCLSQNTSTEIEWLKITHTSLFKTTYSAPL